VDDRLDVGVVGYRYRTRSMVIEAAMQTDLESASTLWFMDHTVSPFDLEIWTEGDNPLSYVVRDPAHFGDPFVSGAVAALTTRRVDIGIWGASLGLVEPTALARAVGGLAALLPERTLRVAVWAEPRAEDLVTGLALSSETYAERLEDFLDLCAADARANVELTLIGSSQTAVSIAADRADAWAPASLISVAEFARLAESVTSDRCVKTGLFVPMVTLATSEGVSGALQHPRVRRFASALADAARIRDLEAPERPVIVAGTPEQVVDEVAGYAASGAKFIVLDSLATLAVPHESAECDRVTAATVRALRLHQHVALTEMV
jgi:alkanesulfonate monooxygenase SsuD/methylene tetrahydromethanopterin reductase-like flavin-dependent oxidoreductase (luciferase family)